MSHLGADASGNRSSGPVCFAHSRSTGDVRSVDTSPLATGIDQALSDTLPFLRCGEESAIHAFGRRLVGGALGTSKRVLDAITEDETRHAAWLAALASALPAPRQASDSQQMTAFFRQMLTRDRGLHFAQIASLDLAVCELLRPLAAVRSVIAAAPEVHAGLASIRRDEARHVRIARSCARELGWSPLQQHKLDAAMRDRLGVLLAPIRSSLALLGIPSFRPGCDEWIARCT